MAPINIDSDTVNLTCSCSLPLRSTHICKLPRQMTLLYALKAGAAAARAINAPNASPAWMIGISSPQAA